MKVTVIGDAFVDIIVRLGAMNAGETHHKRILSTCGGTANVAVQIGKQIDNVSFVGKVGNDVFGSYFVEELKKCRVEPLVFHDTKNPTGICVSLVDASGERTMIADRGANDSITKEELCSIEQEIICSDLVYFSGYSFMSKENCKLYTPVLEICRENSCITFFNPGAPNIINTNFIEIIKKYIDILILNEDEAIAISQVAQCTDIPSFFNSLLQPTIITKGREGCCIFHDSERWDVPTDQESVIDTTGAGDAFSGGYIVGYANQKTLVECATMGNEYAKNFLLKKGRLINGDNDCIH